MGEETRSVQLGSSENCLNNAFNSFIFNISWKRAFKKVNFGSKMLLEDISKLWSLGTKRCKQHTPRLAGATAAARCRQGAGFGEWKERNGACWSAAGNEMKTS